MANQSPQTILTEDRIKEFQSIFKKVFNTDISFEEASIKGFELIQLYKSILKSTKILDNESRTSRLFS